MSDSFDPNADSSFHAEPSPDAAFSPPRLLDSQLSWHFHGRAAYCPNLDDSYGFLKKHLPQGFWPYVGTAPDTVATIGQPIHPSRLAVSLKTYGQWFRDPIDSWIEDETILQENPFFKILPESDQRNLISLVTDNIGEVIMPGVPMKEPFISFGIRHIDSFFFLRAADFFVQSAKEYPLTVVREVKLRQDIEKTRDCPIIKRAASGLLLRLFELARERK